MLHAVCCLCPYEDSRAPALQQQQQHPQPPAAAQPLLPQAHQQPSTAHPLFPQVPPPTVLPDAPLQLLATNIDYDEHKGRIAIGRVSAGEGRR